MGQGILGGLLPDLRRRRRSIALSEPIGGASNQFKNLAFWELEKRSRQFSDFILNLPLEKNSRIAILSESRIDWVASLFGIFRAGMIAVPFDIKLTEEELKGIADDSKPAVLIYSAKYKNLAERLIRSCSVIHSSINLDEELPKARLQKLPSFDPKSTALIIYTSGTTSQPKGVMVSMQSLLFETKVLSKKMALSKRDVLLSMNPLNHALELCTLLCGIRSGAEITFCTSLYPQEFLAIMRAKKVTRMTVVPLFLRLLKNEIDRELKKRSRLMMGYFKKARALAKFLPLQDLRRPLFPFVSKIFGKDFYEFVCGGASLDPLIAEFFESLGISVLQGYGMTEAGPVISFNNRYHNRIGSVGRAMPGTEIKIDCRDGEKVGEVLVKGPHLMRGYFNRPELTAEAIDADGWLHTGDLGRLDPDGYLYITGRTKNLMVLSGGKKVQPEEIEEHILRSAKVKEACVLTATAKEGPFSGTAELISIVVPHESLLSINGSDSIEERIAAELKMNLKDLAPFKHPVKTIIRYEEFPKSSSKKIKRELVKNWLKDQGVEACDG